MTTKADIQIPDQTHLTWKTSKEHIFSEDSKLAISKDL